MANWFQHLPVIWMAILTFAGTYVFAGAIYWVVMVFAVGERARAFKAVSAGMLSPLGIMFGLLVAFVAAQVWSDVDRASSAVAREASALRAVVLLAANFPGEPEAHLRTLLRRHIDEVVTKEWPAMGSHQATLAITPVSLIEALRLALTLAPRGDGQAIAQREMATALQTALEARRQRILISESSVNWVKWTGLLLQAGCTLAAIAFIHSDNRLTAIIAMALFATGAAVCLVLIASHNRPFTGEISVKPAALLQIMPAEVAPGAPR